VLITLSLNAITKHTSQIANMARIAMVMCGQRAVGGWTGKLSLPMVTKGRRAVDENRGGKDIHCIVRRGGRLDAGQF
jgi:hypothetical protein